VQSRHDRRAIAMIAVQTPIDFFSHKNMVFWMVISRRSKKMRTPWDRCESP
jgi:hypothetical protein